MTVLLKPQENKTLSELLIEKNIFVQSPCGGNGKCGKCKIKLLKGKTNPAPDENGFVKSCKTTLLSECEFYIPQSVSGEEKLKDNNLNNSEFPIPNSEFAHTVALCDIGTTNIKMRYYRGGVNIGFATFRNPQFAFGADVISRISACGNGNFKVLSDILKKEIEKHTHGATNVIVCGNPTMIHFMAGVDPSPLGVYPFECVFKNTLYMKKEESGLSFDSLLLPSSSAYVGSDAICGVYYLLSDENNEKSQNILIADLGTNGEISLIKGNKIYSTSTAAGPAIEGACIECGETGGDGVVYSVDSTGKAYYQGENATGINGAGLISLIAYLLESDKLSQEGELEKNPFYIKDEVYVTRKDISEFMLAKSAIKTAIELLLKETDTSCRDIDRFILTGGVLKEIKDVSTVFKTCIAPYELFSKAEIIPDLAMEGQERAYFRNEISALEDISKSIKTLYLSDHNEFEERFIYNSFFE